MTGSTAIDLGDIEVYRFRARQETQRITRERFRPPPELSVSECADQYRILPETSAEPGRWRTSRAPYLKGIMDACSDPEIERVNVMKSSQVGYSEVVLNILQYFVLQDPAPILLVQPTDGEAEKFSKERVAPFIRDCPEVRERFATEKTRSSANTIEAKEFQGGHLGIVGANAPAKLASRPRRVVLYDEVDRFPPSAGAEGDPISIAEKRTTTYWNRLLVTGSSPTIAGLSRIERAFNEGDRRYYRVPCPDCGKRQRLVWANVRWEKRLLKDGRKEHLPDTAAYLCEHCGSLIPEKRKAGMIRQGRWVRTRPFRGVASFHISSLYSPWVKWRELVAEYLSALGDSLLMQVFVNTRLGECWEDTGEVLDDNELLKRREKYAANPLPPGVVLVTAGVDVQDDRLEVEFVGWGRDFESWSLEYLRIPGDTSGPGPWRMLDAALKRTWTHPAGPKLPLTATAIDSGHLTQTVYRFAKDRVGRNVWAIKGLGGAGRPIMGRPNRKNARKVALYPVGTYAAKTQIHLWLQVDEHGPGFCHFPLRDSYDDEHFRQLTGEKLVTLVNRTGPPRREWRQRPGRRNEVLDCRVYALAAVEGLVAGGISLNRLADEMEKLAEKRKGGDDDEPRGRRGGWVKRWKR